MADATLPSFPQGLTPEWLTGVLRDAQVLPHNVRITDAVRSQVGEGVGMMSELSRVTLTYDEANDALPRTLMAKYPSQNPTNRGVAMSYNLYERETRYFSELDPRTTAQTPTCYLSQLDGDNFVILMEDLDDYRVGDQIVGATLEETQLAVDELAKLHAPFWNHVGDIAWIPHFANSYHAENMYNLAQTGWDNMVHIFTDYVPDHIRALRDPFLRAIPRLQELMDQPPITLLHGDFRMENLLYGVAPNHHPVSIIDWQGPLLGRAMFDIALLLGQSTQTEVRRAHEAALIERYCNALATLGVDYLHDQAWDHYVLAQLYDWTYVAVVAGTLDASNQRAFTWMSQMVARQVAATDDLHLESLLHTIGETH